jgi:predicted HicB family RNase H-like nuclease
MKKQSDTKQFNVRLPRKTWLFLKMAAAEQERSMAEIISVCVEKYKRKLENKLTLDDTAV